MSYALVREATNVGVWRFENKNIYVRGQPGSLRLKNAATARAWYYIIMYKIKYIIVHYYRVLHCVCYVYIVLLLLKRVWDDDKNKTRALRHTAMDLGGVYFHHDDRQYRTSYWRRCKDVLQKLCHAVTYVFYCFIIILCYTR